MTIIKDEESGLGYSSTTTDSFPAKRIVLSANHTSLPPDSNVSPPSDQHELSNTSKFDAGLRSGEFYKSRMSPIRFKARSLLLPLVELESKILAHIQHSVRTPFLDTFFLYTANLGSHTFYVLLLPAPAWFGFLTLFRDLVFVLGLGIYFSGLIKDYLCLPRPKSPPLNRLTLSSYTAEEYGCPSSHTANATSVTLILLWQLFKNWSSFNLATSLCFLFGLLTYWTCLVLGRIYCGMHGFVDITLGGLIGIFTVFLRKFFTDLWDQFIYSNSWLVPVAAVPVYYSMIFFHVLPIDPCPCFEDSIAFIGVLLGLDLAHWSISNSAFRNTDPLYPCSVPYSYEQLGLGKSILRVIVGIGCIVIWKTISKPLLLKVLRPVHKLVFGDVAGKQNKVPDGNSWAFVPRYDLTVLVKMIVYAGIAGAAVYVKIAFSYLGLGVEL